MDWQPIETLAEPDRSVVSAGFGPLLLLWLPMDSPHKGYAIRSYAGGGWWWNVYHNGYESKETFKPSHFAVLEPPNTVPGIPIYATTEGPKETFQGKRKG